MQLGGLSEYFYTWVLIIVSKCIYDVVASGRRITKPHKIQIGIKASTSNLKRSQTGARINKRLVPR